jgi:hypothetical protein
MAPDSPESGKAEKVRFNMLLDADLYERLKEFASKSGVTMTDIVIDAIKRVLDTPTDAKEDKYRELINRVGVYVPPPGATEESILNWLSYRLPAVIYNYITALYSLGGEYLDHAHRIVYLCKKNYPTKWMRVMDLFRAYSPDLVEEFGIKNTERVVSEQ